MVTAGEADPAPVRRSSRNVVLIGFASAGKTASGAALAALTGLRHIDLDRELEAAYLRKTGQDSSCREIYRKLGKDRFAEFENSVLAGLQEMADVVLSTGGHAVLHPGNRALLARLGTIIYLRADPDVIRSRMKSKGVPLTVSEGSGDISTEYQRRDAVYRAAADVVIDNSRMTPETTAETIRERLADRESRGKTTSPFEE